METCEFFLDILSGWYLDQLHQIYMKNENIVYSSQGGSRQRNQVSRDFERLEENLSVFLVHMHEKNQEEKYTSKAKQSKRPEPHAAADQKNN